MEKPLVSIIVCTYNRGHLLEQTMESIFLQRYKPVEIIVFDDGSTDETPKIVGQYGEKVRYYRQGHRGAAWARTEACRLARGEFIAFQDDDDLMLLDRISKLYVALQENPSAILAIGDWAVINQDGMPTGSRSKFNISSDENEKTVLIENGYKAVLWPMITPLPHTSLFRKVDGERIGWFDKNFFNAVEDTDFFARLGKLGAIVYLPEVVSYYRLGHNQLMNKKFSLACNRCLLFCKHLKNLSRDQTSLRDRLQVRLLSVLKQIAFFQRLGNKLPDCMPTDYLAQGLTSLSVRNRLEYKSYENIRLPLQILVRGAR